MFERAAVRVSILVVSVEMLVISDSSVDSMLVVISIDSSKWLVKVYCASSSEIAIVRSVRCDESWIS